MKIVIKKVGSKIAFEFIGTETVKFLASPEATDALVKKIQKVRAEFASNYFDKENINDLFGGFGMDSIFGGKKK